MRLNAAELEQAVFLTLKKQLEAAAPLAPNGTLRVDASVPERAEYEQQIETLQDGKRTLYERYLMGEIDLNTYKAEKAACDELLLKTKNAYAAVLAQAKQKQDEQARQDSRKEASKAIFDADTLTTELAELLIDRVLVYPDKRIEIAYKIQDIFIPLQRHEFAPAQTGCQVQKEHLVVTLELCLDKKPLQLLPRQHLHLPSLLRRQLAADGRVHANQSILYRFLQRGATGSVAHAHHSVGQPFAVLVGEPLPAAFLEPTVELLQVVLCQLIQRDVPNLRNDMQADAALVGLLRSGADLRLGVIA